MNNNVVIQKNIYMRLPEHVTDALLTLNDRGFKAYVVGGAVRDHLMNAITNDYDICTDAKPHEILSCFECKKVLTNGIKHGTVTVFIDDEPIEITTFRTDGQYTDNRHPDEVTFTNDLICDLRRRDFTINSLAYHPDCGLIDPFDGASDIKNGVIRAIGVPYDRFSEDALRIIRALRFSSVLEFDIEESTHNAIIELTDRIKYVSAERIREEFMKLLIGKNRSEVLQKYRNVISVFIPELSYTFDFDQNSPHHEFDLYSHLIRTADSIRDNALLSLAGLLHDIAKPLTASIGNDGYSHFYSHASLSSDMARDVMLRLRFSNKDIDYVCALIRFHDGVIEETEKAVKHRVNQLGTELTRDLLKLQLADNTSQKNLLDPDRYRHNNTLNIILDSIISKEACTSLKSLKINGNDLKGIGYVGKSIGVMLDEILNLVIDGKIANNKDILIKYAKEHIK